MQKIILALAGEMGCGKGTISEYLIRTHQAKQYRMSDCLRDILKRMHQENTRTHFQTLSTALRLNFWQDILSQIIAADIADAPDGLIIVDGVRREFDIKHLRELPNFFLIYVDVSFETRYQRIVKRAENPGDNEKTFEQFKHESASEVESSIIGLKYISDYVIENNGTPEELYEKVEEIFQKIGSK